jgi:tetratricopeptide (TPR) repeat protein
MAYPGNPELSPQAQDRVMTAFKQVVGKLQQGNREEALIGLEFVLRLDPAYAPAKNLHQQLSSGSAEIDLNDVLAQLQAPTTDTINNLLVEAVEAYDERDFEGARARVEQVLLDLPGHEEARFLLSQIEEATKGESQVGQFLQQARDALAAGDSQEAANFVMMAQALDPHHKEIADTIALIEQGGEVSLEQAGFATEDEPAPAAPADVDPGEFEPSADTSDLFSDTEHEPPPLGTEGGGDFESRAAVAESAPAPPPPHVTAAPESEPEPTPEFAPEPAPGAAAAIEPETLETVEESLAEPLEEPLAEPVEDYYEDDAAEGLFETGPTMTASEDDAGEVDPSDTHAVIRDLLSKGGTAAAEDDYAAAIDAWSRILLIDHTHEEALDRIEHIRHAKEDIERRIEPMLADARSSHISGDLEMATDFVRRALELSPNHVEATRLQEAILRGAHPDSEGPEVDQAAADEAVVDEAMPELEDDLFTDEFEAISDFGEDMSVPAETLEGEWRTVAKPKRKIPWKVWAGAGVVGIVIVAAAMWFGGFFAPAPEAEPRINVVNRVLTEAREMYNQKRVEEAILHLEQNSADDQFQVRIDNALEEYRTAVATPVPTAVPEGLTACRELLEEGRWMAAYERAMTELKAHPNDPGLEEVRQQILTVEPSAAELHRAVNSGDYRAALAVTKELLGKRPDDGELVGSYDRFLFNAALVELRAFNLSDADAHLLELQQRQPEDEEIERIRVFVETYKTRPADMQLEIFVGSLSER